MPQRILIPVEEEEEKKKIRTLVPVEPGEEYETSFAKELWEQFKPGFKAIPETAGAGLTGVISFGLNILAQPAYGLYRQWKEGFKGVEKPWEIITKTIEKGKPATEFLEKGVYIPKSERARKFLGQAFYPFAKYEQAVDWVSKNVSTEPATQESIKYAGDIALLFGLGATSSLIKSSFKLKKPPKITTIKRTILESKKVPEDVKAKIKLIPEEGKILKPTAKEKGIIEVEKLFRETEKAFEELRKPSVRKAYQTLKRLTIDTSGNVKKRLINDFGELGKEAVVHLDLARGASKKAEFYIARAVNEVYEGLKPAEITLLDDFIQSTRIQKILEYKPKHRVPRGIDRQKHKAFTERLPTKIKERGEAYFDIMQQMLDELLDAGIIDDIAHTNLSAHAPYSPFKFIQHLDPERSYTFGGRRISVPDSGIKKLKEGSYQFLEKNSRLLLAEVINRTQGRIFRNEANKALYSLAEQIPDNGVARAARIIRTTKAGKPIFERTPAGHETVHVMINGKPKKMIMPQEWAREWVLSDPLVNQQVANIVGWFSGSKILKPMATGLNPEFAITNFPRDLAHIWFVSNQYSSFLPKAMAEMGADLLVTMRDVFARKGSYIDYINEGGGIQFLTHQGRVKGNFGKSINKFQDYMGYIGETSELWSRLALRRRAIRRGKGPHEATWEARNYLDFNQGGNLTKAFDSGIPYLNASVQGTRGIFRAIAQRPAQSIWKVSQLGALATGIYLANKHGNPECWDSISDRDKAYNFIITTPHKYTDKSGNERHLFFKIAKDQGQRFFCTIFENLMAKYIGDPVDAEQISMALTDAAPIIPTQNLPPSVDAFIGYMFNKDFWTKEDIWRGPQIKAREEWTNYTHPGMVKAGQLTGLSPERLQYALQQFFTYGNIYTSLTGEGLRLMLGQMPEHYRDRIKEEIVTNLPAVRRFAELTSPYSQQEKIIKKTKIEENTRRYIQQREIDKIAENYFRQLDETGTHNETLWRQHGEYVESQPEEDRERLYNRFDRFEKLYRIPNRGFWLNLMSLPPEARAQLYWAEYRNATQEKKNEMDRMLYEIPGVATKRFTRKLVELESLDK